jgi:hypothetical protein
MMARSLNDKVNTLSKARQISIQSRANELIAEEMTLRDLRQALKKTQVDLSVALHMKQDGVSRLENRSDMLLSTLTKYITAMGGSLKIIAEFPDRPPVTIQSFKDIHSH